MDFFDAVSTITNKLCGFSSNVPVTAILSVLAGALVFVITQWKKIKEFVNEIGQFWENRYLDKKINRPLAGSIEKIRKEPILSGSYEKIFLPKLTVERGCKKIDIDLNPGA